jgi:hypothetical protein
MVQLFFALLVIVVDLQKLRDQTKIFNGETQRGERRGERQNKKNPRWPPRHQGTKLKPEVTAFLGVSVSWWPGNGFFQPIIGLFSGFLCVSASQR